MATFIVNGAPTTIFYGVNDISTRTLVRQPEERPSHLPFFWSYAEKGPTTPQLVVGDSATTVFGSKTFDQRSVYATHATAGIVTANAQGNSFFLKRVIPKDAPPAAGLRLWADVLKTSIPEYERNSDGSIKTDIDGNKITTGVNFEGFKLKWVATAIEIDSVTGESTFGVATQKAGDQTDPTTTVQSVRYPILDLVVPSQGAYGNNNGFRIWAPTQKSSDPIDDRIIEKLGVYPFRVAQVVRSNSTSSGKSQAAQSTAQYLDVVFKKDVFFEEGNVDLYIGDRYIQDYQDLNSANMPPEYGAFNQIAIYDSNVAELVELFYAAELPYADQWSDFTDEEDEAYKFNFVSGVSSQNVPYHTFQIVTDGTGIILTENSTIYAQGGGDGTMNEQAFAELVAEDAVNFSDLSHEYQNSAKYPLSIVYDTGFPLETKYALCNVISVRKDTLVVLSTYDVLGRELTAADESSLATALKTRLQMYPESSYFGTPTCRGVVVSRYGKMIGSQYRKKLPLTLELELMASKYMGAGNGIWDGRQRFDRDPGNLITKFTNINNTYTPVTVRNKDWDTGMIWAQDVNRSEAHFPALKTVYDNDTSILNNFITVCAVAECQKIGEQVWRELTGSMSLTPGELIKEIQDRFNQKISDRGNFDNLFQIEPEASVTAADNARGYSATLKVNFKGNNMFTVLNLSIETDRIENTTEE